MMPFIPRWIQYRTIRKYLDEDFYLKSYPDVMEAKVDPVIHYIEYGWHEGRWPTPYFDTNYYVREYPVACKHNRNPFYHYLTIGQRKGYFSRPEQQAISDYDEFVVSTVSKGIDADYYLAKYPDVATSGLDAHAHYLTLGWKLGYSPTPEFSTEYYLNEHQDVASAGVNPFFHYLVQGRDEGRKTAAAGSSVDSSEKMVQRDAAAASLFDEEFYLSSYPDVAESEMTAFAHFMNFGWREGRNPSATFDTEYYLSSNPDVATAGINPLRHYAEAGKDEGRLTEHPAGHWAEMLSKQEPLDEVIGHWIRKGDDTATPIASLEIAIHSAKATHTSDHVFISLSHDQYMMNTGGVQSCIAEEQLLFNGSKSVYLHISPHQPLPVLADYPSHQTLSDVAINGDPVGCFETLQLIAALKKSLSTKKSTLIVHAMHGHSAEWVLALYRALSFEQAFFWLHDYLSICPGYNLLRNGIRFCHAPDASSPGCQLCVYGEHRPANQEQMRRLFENIPFIVVAPSRFALDLWKDKAGLPYAKSFVHEHRKLESVEEITRDKLKHRPLRVAFLGHPASHKGWEIYRDLTTKLYRDTRYHFLHLGESTDKSIGVEFVRVTTSTEAPHAMAEALREHAVDVVLLLSICPETFGLTAYEAMAAGAMVVTTRDSGNVAAAVIRENKGECLDSEQQLREVFQSGEIVSKAERFQAKGIYSCKLVHSGVTASLVLGSHGPMSEEA